MSHSFCRYLTNGFRIQSWYGTLAASPCCYLPLEPIKSSNFDSMLKKYRLRDHCSECLGFVSGNAAHPSYPPTQSKKYVLDSDHTHPVYVELSIDNKCNAACLSCTDNFSTLWERQNIKFKIKSKNDYPDPQDNKKVVDDLFENFNFSYLRLLNFLGGEPIISSSTWMVLDRLNKLGLSNNIEIIFTTNGSVAPNNDQCNLLYQFKKVNFVFSIDGIGDQFYYLRYPLNWEKVNNVYNSIRQNKNFSTAVNTTVNCLNAFYLNELKSWVGDSVWYLPSCNDILSTNSLPNEALKFLKDKHSDHPQLSKLFSINTQKTSELVDYLNFWDQNRKLDWKTTFPLAALYLNY